MNSFVSSSMNAKSSLSTWLKKLNELQSSPEFDFRYNVNEMS